MKAIIKRNVFLLGLILMSIASVKAQTINGPAVVCPDVQYTYNIMVVSNDYTWAATGGSIIGSNKNSSVNVKWNSSSGTKQISVTYYNSGGGPGPFGMQQSSGAMSFEGTDSSDSTEVHTYSRDSNAMTGNDTTAIESPTATTMALQGGGGGSYETRNTTIYINKAGSVSSNATKCEGSGGTVNLSGHFGVIEKWQKRTYNGSWSIWSDISNTSTSYTYSNIQLRTRFRAVIDAECGFYYSGYATIYVNKPSIGGTVSGGGSVCSGGSKTLTLSGKRGSVKYWQQSLNGGLTWSNINNTSTSLTRSNITQTTVYRANVKNGVCSSVFSSQATVSVTPISLGGTTSGGGTHCGSGSGTISLSGKRGNVLKWQKRTNGGSWSNITNTSTTQTFNHSSVGTYEYRAQVKNGVCSAVYSSISTVTITAASNGGTVALAPQGASPNGSNTISSCGSIALTAHLESQVGNVVKWQKSSNGGSTWQNITHTGATYDFTATSDVLYRAVVKNGSNCSQAYSASASVTINTPTVAGTISLPTTTGINAYCKGTDVTMLVSGRTGEVTKWKYKVAGTSTWYDIPNSATSSYTYSDVDVDKLFQAEVKSGFCSALWTPLVTVSVKEASADITVSGTNNVCGPATGTIDFTNLTGELSAIQYSTDGVNWGAEFPILTPGTTFIDYNVHDETKHFRGVIELDDCAKVYTDGVEVTSTAVSDAGTINVGESEATVFLDEASGTVEAQGSTVGDLVWQVSTNGNNFSDITPLEAQTSYSYNNLNTDHWYRLKATNQQCAVDFSNPVHIEVRNSGYVTAPSSVAYGSEISVVMSDFDGEFIDWEVSIDGGATYEVMAQNYGYQYQYQGAYPYIFTILEDTKFRAQIDVDDFGVQYKEVTVLIDELAPPATNYREAQSTTLLNEVTDPGSIPASGSGALTTASYFDGLGNPIKTVSVSSTPLQQDMVSFQIREPNSNTATMYMPYVAANASGSNIDVNNLKNDQAAFYENTSDDVTDSDHPFAQSQLESSPIGRVTEQGAPGADWQLGNGHTIGYEYRTNDVNEVRVWKEDGTSDSFYPAQTLWVVEMTDENGHVAQTFTDKSGKTILNKKQSDGGTWISTGYIYDLVGRVKYTISPEGMKQIATTGSVTLSQNFIDQWVFEYVYDELGRVVEKKVPGKAVEYFVYDEMDRLILSQDGILRAIDQWVFVKYDQRHRKVMTGLYTDETNTTRSAMQTEVTALDYDGSDSYFEEKEGSTAHGYSNQAFPLTDTEVLSVFYYDNYDLDADGGDDHAYITSGLTPEPEPFDRVSGLPTASKVKVLDSDPAQWLTRVAFYDKYGRVIQTWAENHIGGYDRSTLVYGFSGKVTQYRSTHNDGSTSTIMDGRNTYDHAERLLKSHLKIDSDPEIEIASYSYNEMGQLISKDVHSEDMGTSYLQQINYGYNIRGWVKNINNPDQLGDDYYAQELVYNETMGALSHNAAYNGNITGMKWAENTSDVQNIEQKAYAYSYDDSDRLTAANYGEGTNYATATGRYNENNLAYDANGNMESLDRFGESNGATEQVDQLSYNYANGNQLEKVDDIAANPLGFSDASGVDYQYDINGNVMEDNNKGIESITYNFLNKPTEIVFDDGKELHYTYDAAGAKLSLALFDGTTSLRKTDYSGAFEYKNDTLEAIHTGEGKILPGESAWLYEYYQTDHLGNVRVAYRNQAESITFTATMESENSTTEEEYFTNLDECRAPDIDAVSGNEVARLNSAQIMGPGIALPVYPGDEVDMSVYAYHRGGSGYSNAVDLTALISAVAGAFGGNPTGTTAEQASYAVVDNALNPTNGGIGLAGTSSDSRPAAYLNYLLFDKAFTLVQHGHAQIGVDADTQEVLSIPDIIAQQEGFIYIYLTNESNTLNEVYFDDLAVTINETNIVQKNSYYPYGLQHDNSWTRAGRENKYKFNAGSELNEETGNYETYFRQYDPTIGRFMGVDILASSYSSLTPYQFANNDPVYYNDPNGDSFGRISVADINRARTDGSDASWTWNLGGSGMFSSGMWYGAGSGYARANGAFGHEWGYYAMKNGVEDGLNGDISENKMFVNEGNGNWGVYDGSEMYITRKDWYNKETGEYLSSDYIFSVESGKTVFSRKAQSGGNPHVFNVYSPDQISRIMGASNDGEALKIALYGLNNSFVDKNGNPSDYAARLFKKKFPNSSITFPSNGKAVSFKGAGSGKDILIRGLNFETGQFEDLRRVPNLGWWDSLSDADKERIGNIGANIINIIRLLRGQPMYDPFPPGVPIYVPEGG